MQNFDASINASLQVLKKNNLLNQERRALVERSPHPDLLAQVLEVIDRADLITQENIVSILWHPCLNALKAIVAVLDKADSLTLKRLDLITALNTDLDNLAATIDLLHHHSVAKPAVFNALFKQKDFDNIFKLLRLMEEKNIFTLEYLDCVLSHTHPLNCARRLVSLIQDKVWQRLTFSDRAAVIAHPLPSVLARALINLRENGVWKYLSENDRDNVFAHPNPDSLESALTTFRNNGIWTLLMSEEKAAVFTYIHPQHLASSLKIFNTSKNLKTEEQADSNVKKYVYSTAPYKPFVGRRLCSLIAVIDNAIEKAKMAKQLPIFECVELPFTIDENVLSEITRELDSPLPLVQLVSGLWYEGRIASVAREYCVNLNVQLMPVLKAAIEKSELGTFLLDKKRLVYSGCADPELTEATIEVAAKYYENKKKLSQGGVHIHHIINHVDCAVGNLVKLVRDMQTSEEKLCQAVECYVTAAEKDPVLTELVQFFLWEIRVTRSLEFASLKQLFQQSPYKEWSESPPCCYGGETYEKLPGDGGETNNNAGCGSVLIKLKRQFFSKRQPETHEVTRQDQGEKQTQRPNIH